MSNVGETTSSGSFTTLVTEHHRAYTVALRVLGSAEAAEEVVQETYLKLMKNPPNLANDEQALLYLLRAVRHTALDFIKTEKNRKRREVARVMDVKPENNPEAQAAQKELALMARAVLEKQPSEVREAISLCCELGMTHRAAAEVMGVPERTASSRVQRGLAEIQRVLMRSGFASAAPLIGEHLRQLGGPQAPQNLTEKVGSLAKKYMSSRPTAPRHKPLRQVPARSQVSGVSVIAAGVAVTLLAGVAFSQRSAQAPASATSSSVAPSQPTQTSAAARTRLSKTWTFEQGPSADFEKTTGDWMWNPKERAMDCGANIGALLPPLPEPHEALLFRATVKSHHAGSVSLGVGWADEKGVLEHDTMMDPNSATTVGVEYVLDCYCVGSHIYGYLHGVLTADIVYPADGRRNRLILQGAGYSVYSISLTETSEANLPDQVKRDIAAFKAPSNWMHVRTPFITFDVPARPRNR